jgi:2-dehydropantoate 2-reductase
MINVGVNQTSAVLNAPFGVFQSSKDAGVLMEKAMSEVITMAKTMNVNLVDKENFNAERISEKISQSTGPQS